MDQDQTPSAYDAIGGGQAIGQAVDRLYERILKDDELAPYFESVDVFRVKRHMAALLSQVLGGPSDYTGRELGDAHHGLGITDQDYDKVGAHLGSVLTEMNVDPEILQTLTSTLTAVKPTIVNA